VSCASTRTGYPGSTSAPPPKSLPRDPQFPENISIKPETSTSVGVVTPEIRHTPKDLPGMVYSTDIEKCNALQFKYAILMESPVEEVTNAPLISFLESWYGTRYKMGGTNKSGIDCSAFTSILMDSVFTIKLPRTAKGQYDMGSKIQRDYLQQGDLVFFNTTGGISHVGVYLTNNKFVHASTTLGVIISDMDELYYRNRYIGATRVK
jgi:hypothetical protein